MLVNQISVFLTHFIKLVCFRTFIKKMKAFGIHYSIIVFNI